MELLEIPKSLQREVMTKYKEVLHAKQKFTMEDNFILILDNSIAVGLFSYMLNYDTAYNIHVVSLDSSKFGKAFIKFCSFMKETYDRVEIQCTDPATMRICEKKYRKEGDTYIWQRKYYQ